MCSADVFLGLLAILFPPLPVWVKCGICSADSVINLLLCVLGYLPGLLHAWYIIAKFPEPLHEYEVLPQDREGGRVTYVYVQPAHSCHHEQRQQPPPPRDGMGYGTQSAGRSPAPPPQQQGVTSSAEGSATNQGGVPPSYAEVVAGDHKIQT